MREFVSIFFAEHHRDRIISRGRLIALDRLMHIATLNFHDAAKFEPARINGGLLSFTLLPRSCCPSRRRNGKSETRRAKRQSALGGVTNCKLIASIYISAGAMKAHVRIGSHRRAAWFSGFPVATSSPTRNSASYTCKSSKFLARFAS